MTNVLISTNARHWLTWAACAALMHLCAGSRASAQESESLIRQLKNEVPKMWAEYAQAFSGTLRYIRRTSSLDRLTKKKTLGTFSRVEYGSHGIMEWYQNFDEGGGGYAYVMNDRYAFEVKKPSGDRGWVAAAVRVKAAGEREGDYATPRLKGWKKTWPAAGPFSASGFWLPKLMTDDGLILTTAKEIVGASGHRVRFDFTYDKTRKNALTPSKGWVILDPTQSWRVCESEIHVRDSGDPDMAMTIHWTVHCELDGEFPVLKRTMVKAKGRENGKDVDAETTMEYTVDRNDSAAAEFRLTAFGLPEPHGIVWPQPTRWYLWIGLATLGALALGILFRTLKRRYQTAQPVRA